jgi:hypothetical protein
MSSLTEKIGPLPVWAYGVIVGGGLYLYRRSHPAATTADGTSTDGSSTPPAGSDAGMPSTAPAVPQSPDNGSATPTPQTNAEWKQRATQLVLQLNSWSAYQIDNALSAYLGGQTLDASQQSIVSQAIRMAGSPPTAPPSAPGTGTKTDVATLSVSGSGVITPTPNGGRVAARMTVAGLFAINGTPASGSHVIGVQENNSFTGKTWSTVSHMTVTNGHGTAPVNLAKGSNQIRLQTGDGKATSNTLTIAA